MRRAWNRRQAAPSTVRRPERIHPTTQHFSFVLLVGGEPQTYFAIWCFRFSLYKSHTRRRSPCRATGPPSVNSREARAAESNFGQRGRLPPLGSPVLAKLVQYVCIAADTC